MKDDFMIAYRGRKLPNISYQQPNWSWDAELMCIEQGFRVFKHQEDDDMGMGPLFDLEYEEYRRAHE